MSIRRKIAAIVGLCLLSGTMIDSWFVASAAARAEMKSIDSLLAGTAKTIKPKVAIKQSENVKDLNALAISIVSENGPQLVVARVNGASSAIEVPTLAWSKALTLCHSAQSIDSPAGHLRVIGRCVQQDKAVVVVATPLAEMERRIIQTRMNALGIALVSAIISYILASLAMRKIMRRLTALSESAAQIGSGDLDAPVANIEGHDELANLSQLIRTMVANLKSKITDLEASSERMRRLISTAGHELRTPLTVIQGYAQILERRNTQLSDQDEIAIKRIISETNRLDALIQHILDSQTINSSKNGTWQMVDLVPIFIERFEDLTQLAPACTVDIDATSVDIWGNAALLRRIASNLVQNISRHSNTDCRVQVSIRNEGTAAVIEISDDGPGLEDMRIQEILENISSHSPISSEKGLGLGLGIVHEAVAAHGGSLLMKRNVSGGLTTRIEFPTVLSADQSNVS